MAVGWQCAVVAGLVNVPIRRRIGCQATVEILLRRWAGSPVFFYLDRAIAPHPFSHLASYPAQPNRAPKKAADRLTRLVL